MAALFLPRRSATYFLGNTLFDTGGEAVIFFFLARSIDKVELLVFGQSDLEVVAWQRLASELPKLVGYISVLRVPKEKLAVHNF